MLALELLKILLENSGHVFATSEKFATAIKQYLCLSLLKNCASAIPHALRLSCSIFLTLISKFRQSLKAEIGVFFPMILLRSIEPQLNSSPQQPGAYSGSRAYCQSAFSPMILVCAIELTQVAPSQHFNKPNSRS